MSAYPNAEAVNEVSRMLRTGGSRLVTIVAAEEGEGMVELIYIVDRQGEIHAVRSVCPWEEELESLSTVYKGAENMEREIVDLFGARFAGVKGGLFLEPGTGNECPMRLRNKGV